MRVQVRPARVRLQLDVAAKASRAAEEATKVVAFELNGAFQDALGSKVWSWPRVTIRKSSYDRNGRRAFRTVEIDGVKQRVQGFPVSSPRNIVDRGTLRASNSFAVSGTLVTFRWAVGYATAVHDGARIYPFGDRSREQVLLPARPWTSAVLGTLIIPGLDPYPYRETFRAAFISAFRRL